MTLEQVQSIRESYMVESTRPDGRKSTRSEYIRICLDGGIELVTSKDLVIFDDNTETVHAICVNDDMRSQSLYPVKVISSNYGMIQQLEGIMSQKDFEAFLGDGFISGLISDTQKEFITTWTRNIRNQAQQPLEAEPYFNTNPKIIPKGETVIKREELKTEDDTTDNENTDNDSSDNENQEPTIPTPDITAAISYP